MPTKADAERIKPWQFKPGQSGNPAGRKKRPTFEELVRNVLDQSLVLEAEDGSRLEMTKREALAEVLVDEMIGKRNPAIIREYLKREWPEIQQHLLAGIVAGTSDETRIQLASRFDRFAQELELEPLGSDEPGGDDGPSV